MKKYLAIILGAVFVLGFAASAFAIHAEIPAETQAVVAKGATQISIGGDIRMRGEMTGNTTDFNKDTPDHKEFYNGRVRLSVDAKVTPNTEGLVMIEAASGPTGTGSPAGIEPLADEPAFDAATIAATSHQRAARRFQSAMIARAYFHGQKREPSG